MLAAALLAALLAAPVAGQERASTAQPTGNIVGVVIDAQTRQPLPATRVRWWSWGGAT